MNKESDLPLPRTEKKQDEHNAIEGKVQPVLPQLKLESLADRLIIPPGEHPYLMHRAMICLDSQGHKRGVCLTVVFDGQTTAYDVTWEEDISERIKNSITDLVDAVEKSALAFTFLIMKDCTGMEIVKQAKRKSGFDYFLLDNNADDRLIFQGGKTARLEVTGILCGDNSDVESRFQEKFKRALKYQQFKTMPIYVCVVEHSEPKAEVRVRHA